MDHPTPSPPEQNLTSSTLTTRGRYVWANQVRAWAQSIPPWRWVLVTRTEISWSIITRTEITWQKADAMQPPSWSSASVDHLHPLLLLSPSGKEEWTTQSTRTRNIKGRGSLLKMSLSLPEDSLFIDAEVEPPRIQNFYHIWRDSLNPELFDMSDQSHLIQFCHTISSIMKSRFGPLIRQL